MEPLPLPSLVQYHNFFSSTLSENASYGIYLPPGYDSNTSTRYPVLYWLHGGGGNVRAGEGFVDSLNDAISRGVTWPFIVVLPNGPDTLWTNSNPGATSYDAPIESLIINELIPLIDSNYRTIASRTGRGIEGFSMGGRGSSRLGLMYPDKFGLISDLAGAVHPIEFFQDADRAGDIYPCVFGSDPAYFAATSPQTHAAENRISIQNNPPHFRIVVGSLDEGNHFANLSFSDFLTGLGIAHTFATAPGVAHSYENLYAVQGDAMFTFFRNAWNNVSSGATPDTRPPTIPKGLVGTAASSSRIDLSWTASTDAIVVSGYKVFRGGILIATTTATNFFDNGLAETTTYSYTVAAYDAAGNTSRQTAAITVKTLDTTAPSTPTGLTATPISKSQINLAWTASTDNVAVTGYKIYRGGVQIATTTTTTYSNIGLTEATAYSYTVAAYDAAGNTAIQSTTANATTLDATAPSVPTGLTATPITSVRIDLAWTASTDNVAVTGYKIYQGGVQIATTTTTNYSNSSLAEATSYNYTVAAYDAAGNTSAQSTVVTAKTPDVTVPARPTGLLATPISKSQINLAWTASTDNVAVTGYKIYRGGVQIATTTTATYSNTGLTEATAYSYTVAAYDAAGNTSTQSTTASATTLDATAPSVPTGLTATPITSVRIDLAWTASTDNVAVTGYKIYQGGVQIGSSTKTTFSNTGLTEATTYSYTVAAYDTAGNTSAQSTVVTAKTPDVTAPARPTGLLATPISKSQINLAWTASTDNVAVTGYKIYRGGVQIATTTTATYSNTGLTEATAYSYTVAAYDAAGNTSTQSTTASATTLDATAPSVPTGLTATPVTGARIDLAWTAATDNLAVTGYKVYRGGVQIATTNSLTYADKTLVPGTTYTFTVAAYDATGNTSAQSAPKTATTLP